MSTDEERRSIVYHLLSRLPPCWVEQLRIGKQNGTHTVYRSVHDPDVVVRVQVPHPVMWCETSIPDAHRSVRARARGVLCIVPYQLTPGGTPLGVYDPWHRTCTAVTLDCTLVPREEESRAAAQRFLHSTYVLGNIPGAERLVCSAKGKATPPQASKRVERLFQAWMLIASTLNRPWTRPEGEDEPEMTPQSWMRTIDWTIAMEEGAFGGELKGRMGILNLGAVLVV